MHEDVRIATLLHTCITDSPRLVNGGKTLCKFPQDVYDGIA